MNDLEKLRMRVGRSRRYLLHLAAKASERGQGYDIERADYETRAETLLEVENWIKELQTAGGKTKTER